MRLLLTIAASLFAACWLCGATWYVQNPGGDDANAGTSPAAPLLTLQAAFDSVGSGDTAYLEGGEAPASSPTTVTAGADAGSYISIIGVASIDPLVRDGTPFAIDASSANPGMDINHTYYYFENITISGSAGNNWDLTGNYFRLSNCGSTGAGLYGFDWNFGTGGTMDNCVSTLSTSHGVAFMRSGAITNSELSDNGGDGINADYFASAVGNVFLKNTNGMNSSTRHESNIIMHNVFSGNSAAGLYDNNNASSKSIVKFNRFVYNDYGIRFQNAGSSLYEDYNYIDSNTTADLSFGGQRLGGTHTLTDGIVGLVDTSGDSVTLVGPRATYWRQIAEVGMDSTNLYYGTAGLPPADTACAGGASIYNPIIIRHGF